MIIIIYHIFNPRSLPNLKKVTQIHPKVSLKHTQTIHSVCSVWDKGYRYGFNGMDKDNEINVNGGSYDFGARIYDSRLGRWLSLDPLMKSYPELSSYIGMGSCPILYKDVDGKFIISDALKASYPNLEVAIANVYKFVESLSEKKVEEMCNISGFVNREDILKMLKPGEGPTLEVRDITDFVSEKDAKPTAIGRSLGVNVEGIEAATNPSGKLQSTITLDDAVAVFINDKSSNLEKTRYIRQIFLHEIVHSKQIEKGEKIKENPAYQFEEIATGWGNQVSFINFGYKYEPPNPLTSPTPSTPTTPSDSSKSNTETNPIKSKGK